MSGPRVAVWGPGVRYRCAREDGVGRSGTSFAATNGESSSSELQEGVKADGL